MWRIGGFVLIERLGERLGQFLHLPFEMIHRATEMPTLQQIIDFARGRAQEFLGMLEDTVDAHRFDYGEPGEVIVVFSTFHF